MRLIDANALIIHIVKKYGLIEVILDIDEAPTIDANPVKHGKWIYVEDVPLEDGQTEYDREAWYQCSECDAYDLRLKDCHADYCWSCGAKMDEEEREDETD